MRVYHYKRKGGLLNFGDDLGPATVEFTLSETVKFGGPMTANIMGVGSILSTWSKRRAWRRNICDKTFSRKPIAIWGSGVIGQREVILPRCTILAVRGPLTQKVIGCDKIAAFGDPGLLASRMIEKVTSVNKIGIVPHYVDKNHPVVRELQSDKSFTVIDVEQEWHRVLAQISACDLILSSSLHGLIVADSYGIPNSRLSFSDAIVGGDFKFFDYGLSVGRGKIEAHSVVSIKDVYRAAHNYKVLDRIVSSRVVHEINDRLMDRLLSWAKKDHSAGL